MCGKSLSACVKGLVACTCPWVRAWVCYVCMPGAMEYVGVTTAAIHGIFAVLHVHIKKVHRETLVAVYVHISLHRHAISILLDGREAVREFVRMMIAEYMPHARTLHEKQQ